MATISTSSASTSSATHGRKRIYCPHCDEHVSRSLYYRHKQLYFDCTQHEWKRRRDSSPASLPASDINFEFSPDGEYRSSGLSAACASLEDEDLDLPPCDETSSDDDVLDDAGLTAACSELEIDIVEDEEIDEGEESEDTSRNHRVIHIFLFFLFLWQSLFRLSDTAISLMLLFMAKFLAHLGSCFGVQALHQLSEVFPRTLYRAKKYLGRLQERFVRFATCPKCHKLYKKESCWTLENSGKKVSRTCSYVRYPRHIQARMRAPCASLLLKTVRSSSGSEYLAPIQTYCYVSVIESLEALLNRPNMASLCEVWRNRYISLDRLGDVYDGYMWQHFQYDSAGRPFLAKPLNYLLMLNCDWFQPFRHTRFSIGVIYLAVENLPRELRFKRENILIVGIIPGPSEPSMNINSYLEPLIDELESLWNGVAVTIKGQKETIRAALSCIACDVPAARKVGGFIGHKGKRGCSRCLKEFKVVNFGDYPDYSGFKKCEWEPRTHALHVWFGLQHKHARTEEERKQIESEHGARFSSLFRLPYYNAIASCIIDPMHCLFLGIAKKVFKVWLSNGIISEDQLVDIQKKVDGFCCPPDIGRIPYKIASKVSGLKADQWKNWTLYFSLYALKGAIPHRDYDCWLMFVKVCTMICRREIMKVDLEKIDEAMEDFCTKLLDLYGKGSLTPNMHLAGHITDCIRDHGPVYAFWLYAFERMNGILGSFQTSNHDVTVQLMRKFMSMQDVAIDQWPEEFRTEFASVFESCCRETGSLSETTAPQRFSEIVPLPPIVEKAFNDLEIDKIQSLMGNVYPGCSLEVLKLYRSSLAIAVDDSIKLASERSRYNHCSKVFVQDKELVEINHFVQCTVLVTDPTGVQSAPRKHLLVHCSPYMDHPCKPWYGYPTQVWASTLTTNFNFVLLNQITSRVVYVKTKVNFGSIMGEDCVLIVSPIPFYYA